MMIGKIPRLTNILCAFFLLICIGCSAQDSSGNGQEEKKAPTLTNPMNLSPEWWNYYTAPLPLVKQRVDRLKQRLHHLTEQLEDEKQREEAEILIKRISANFVLYSKLRDQQVKQVDTSWIPKEKYPFSTFISLAEKVRSTQNSVEVEENALAWQKEYLAGQRQNASNLFALYRETGEQSVERLLLGLQVIFQRSRVAYLEEELTDRQEEIDGSKKLLERYKKELTIASDHIDFSTVDVEKFQKEKDEIRSKLRGIEKDLLLLETELLGDGSGKDITKPQQSTSNLVMMDLLITETLLKAKLHFIDAVVLLKDLKGDQKDNRENIQKHLHEWSVFGDSVLEQMNFWKESIGIESDLVCKAMVNQATDEKEDEKNQEAERQRDLCFQKMLDVNISLEKLSLNILQLDLIADVIQEEIISAQTVSEQIGFHYQQQLLSLMDILKTYFYYSLFEIGGIPVTLMGMLKVFIIYIVAYLLSKILKRTIRRVARRKRRLAEPTVYVLNRVVHYFILFFATLIALYSLGLTLGNLAIVLGALGIGIGFGLQNMVNNFLSGITVLLGRNVKIGDYIELSTGHLGQVKEINMQHTTVHTFDGTDLIVPNSSIVGNQLTNWTKSDPFQRLHVPFGVAYGTAQELVKEVAVEAAKKVPSTVLNFPNIPEPDVWLIRFGDNALEFELIVWVNIHVSAGRSSMRAAYLGHIEKGLKERGITIPFPQRDLHLKTVSEEFEKASINLAKKVTK